MDNYFKECPAMMSDGRLFTDYSSSQVREQLFKYKNNLRSENSAMEYRTNNGQRLLDMEWNDLRKTKSCFPQKVCYHTNNTTRVSAQYNYNEIMAYNGDAPATKCPPMCYDYRATITPGSISGLNGCKKN